MAQNGSKRSGRKKPPQHARRDSVSFALPSTVRVSMAHPFRQGIVGLTGIMYLCLSALPFLTSRGLAEEHADTRVSDTTVSDLIAALKDPDPIVRQGVAITLGGLRKLAAAAVPVLIEALKDLDPHTSSIVARALVSIAIAAQDAA